MGYTYGSAAVATVVREHLADVVRGRDPMAIGAAWDAMVRSVRNIGRPGIASHAIAAWVETGIRSVKMKIGRA